MTATFPVMLCLVALLAAPATAPSGPTTLAQQLSEFDRKIVEELRAVNPEAVPIFVEANETRAREDHRRAADLYARVVAMAPGFSHALRRQAHEEIALGHRVEAIGLARRAVAIDRSAENLSSLASVLVSGTTESLTSPLEKAEALSLAKQAEAL